MELRPLEPDTDNAGVGSDRNFLGGTGYRCLLFFYFIRIFSGIFYKIRKPYFFGEFRF